VCWRYRGWKVKTGWMWCGGWVTGIGVELRGHESLFGWEGCVWHGRLYEFGGVGAWGDGDGRVYAMYGQGTASLE
jgi:hypothetical protein